jgi:hypothetical protein
MTKTSGPRKKQNRKNYQYLRNSGAHPKRKEFIDFDYLDKLSPEETQFLASFAKEYYHASFETTEETKALYRDIMAMVSTKANKKFFDIHGHFPTHIEQAISEFNAKSKEAGNVYASFFDQAEIYSNDYKRRVDIHNKAAREARLDTLKEEWESEDYFTEDDETIIEDLITESEDD